MRISPDDLDDVVPLLKVKAPLTPAVPPSAVLITKLPLDVAVPVPVTSDMNPPVCAVLAPPETLTCPPCDPAAVLVTAPPVTRT